MSGDETNATLILPGLQVSGAQSSDEEKRRLEELYSMDVLDESSDERLEAYTELVASALDAPIASVVLVDRHRIVVKAVQGRVITDVDRESSFADHAMREQGLFTIEDTLDDPRFEGHPLVRHDPHVRSYAGSVIRGPSGQGLGVLCVMDVVPRQFTEKDRSILLQLTHILEHELEYVAKVSDLRQRIHDHVLVDSATQLPNEALFTARLARMMGRSQSEATMLALIRLERFESIHSAVGKPGAAHVVKEAASRLRKELNSGCLIGQTREDTIAVALALSRIESQETEAERMLQCFRGPFLLGEHRLAQSVSIGTALHPQDAGDSDTLIKRARTALNTLPPTDVSNVRRYDRQLSVDAARQFKIETALRGAIDRDELELFYQPKFSMDGRTLVGAEALLRWTTSHLGMVAPSEFIPIAEERGLILELGDWVLETACSQLSVWSRSGLNCPALSVNVSSLQLRQPTFIERVGSLSSRYSVEASRLDLEVTESTLIENIGDAIGVMSALRRTGISFSIDDFGKGFSSLSYLARMPVQSIKIDRGFIDRVPMERTSMALIRSVVAMGHALGLVVVAEGVENEQQLNFLRMVQCDYVQGYLFGRPVDAREFEARYLATVAFARPSQ